MIEQDIVLEGFGKNKNPIKNEKELLKKYYVYLMTDVGRELNIMHRDVKFKSKYKANAGNKLKKIYDEMIEHRKEFLDKIDNAEIRESDHSPILSQVRKRIDKAISELDDIFKDNPNDCNKATLRLVRSLHKDLVNEVETSRPTMLRAFGYLGDAALIGSFL